MSAARLLLHQMRFDQKRFRRDPAGLFYAIGFPLVFLITFLAVIGGVEERAHIAGHSVSNKPYYIGAIIAMTVISVTFVNLAVSLTAARERGTLKRVRGTRLPPWVFVAARIGTAILVTAATVVAVAIVGWAAYGVEPPSSTLPGAVLALVVGAAAFCCLAFALTIAMPSANAAAAVTMTATLVLYFVSGFFAREDNIPETLRRTAGVFPPKRLFEALVIAFDPTTGGAGIRWWDLAVVAAWGAGGLLLALRFFRWAPSSE